MTKTTSISTPSSLYQPVPSLEDCNQFVINYFSGKPEEQVSLLYWNENKQGIYQAAIQCKNTTPNAPEILTQLTVPQIALLLLTNELIDVLKQFNSTNNASNP